MAKSFSNNRLHSPVLRWYDAHRRDLPWRRDAGDPWRVLLSEAMLQQTRVETVLPYYERFCARWPTLAAFAAAAEDDVLAGWSGLGYYSRARNLHAAARACMGGHAGRVPADEDAVRALPGVGPYTAGAVLSIAFGRPVAAVDGNVVRVLSRLFRVEDESPRRRVEALAAGLVPGERPGDWNQALMELGATVCTPRGPRCAACPVVSLCAARKAGVEAELPRRAPARAPAEAAVAVAVCRRGGRTLLVRRPRTGLLARMWAPPCVEGASPASGANMKDAGKTPEIVRREAPWQGGGAPTGSSRRGGGRRPPWLTEQKYSTPERGSGSSRAASGSPGGLRLPGTERSRFFLRLSEELPRDLARAFPALRIGEPIAEWTHRFTHKIWRCMAFRCEPRSRLEGAQWFAGADLGRVPAAFRPALSTA